MDILHDNILNIVLGALFLVTILSGFIPFVMKSPVMRVFRRWIRAAFFTLAFAIAINAFLPDRNFAALCLCGFLVFFFAETFLYWIKISAANLMCPLFEKYLPVDTAWSAESEDIKTKHEIENLGYKKAGAIKARLFEDVEIRTTSFDSPDGTVRLNVTFLPDGDIYGMASSAVSRSKNGDLYITDSSPTPFGLVLPKHWIETRKPLVNNPVAILKFHNLRLESARKNGEEFLPIGESSVDFANARVGELERETSKSGLLSSPEDREFDGVLNQEGRFRVWLDLIRLNYFPFFLK